MTVLITEFMDEAAVATLAARLPTDYLPTLVDARARMLERLPGVRALIVRNRTQVDAEVLAAAPDLKVVGRLGVGLDNIDVAACAARGVAVIPATGANALAVAEYVIGTSMALLRQAYTRSSETASGAWPRTALSNGAEISGKTLGLVGFGGIGQLCARLAHAMGMQVIAHDPMLDGAAPVWKQNSVMPCSMAELLARADIVSLHVPLTPETRNLIDAAALAAMRPGSMLINTSRGGIVDEAALAQALRHGRLGGAALDVFAQEPLPADNPLAGLPNLILTPHIAGVTVESNSRVSSLIADRVLAALTQEAP